MFNVWEFDTLISLYIDFSMIFARLAAWKLTIILLFIFAGRISLPAKTILIFMVISNLRFTLISNIFKTSRFVLIFKVFQKLRLILIWKLFEEYWLPVNFTLKFNYNFVIYICKRELISETSQYLRLQLSSIVFGKVGFKLIFRIFEKLRSIW